MSRKKENAYKQSLMSLYGSKSAEDEHTKCHRKPKTVGEN